MKLHKSILTVTVAIAALLSMSCIELVSSLNPWFDIEEAVVDGPRLEGAWCLDEEDGGCSRDERMKFVRGPGNSWNVLVGGKVRHRVWVGEIEGMRYLDWMFLCEPSRNAEEDDCLSLDLGLGRHLLTQVTLLEEDRIELRLLDGETFEHLLSHRAEPLEYARTKDGLVVVEDSVTLGELLSQQGRRLDLWYEETMVLTRARAGRKSR